MGEGEELSKTPLKGLSPSLASYSVIAAGRCLVVGKPVCMVLGLQGAMVKTVVGVI